MQEMFDTALLLASQPVPPGPRVAVLANVGGHGALTARAAERRDWSMLSRPNRPA
jgi:acyl-CoA synthetase (NDP forming)